MTLLERTRDPCFGTPPADEHPRQPLRLVTTPGFDMDDVTTDLTLTSTEYDPSPSAEYGSWLLLEKETEPAQLALED